MKTTRRMENVEYKGMESFAPDFVRLIFATGEHITLVDIKYDDWQYLASDAADDQGYNL